MKKITLSLVGAIALFSCGKQGAEEVNITLNSNIDSVSYAIGFNTADNLKKQFSEGNMDAFLQGFKDVVDSNELLVATEDVQGILQAFSQKKQAEMMAKQQEEQAAMYGNVKEEGLAFLAENKSKPGVKVTASGLQYIVLKEGTGSTHPTATDSVEVHYHGTTPNGDVFDSSVDRGEKISFPLNGVIKGWTEGLQLMTVGAKYKFFIPQELAYGAGAPGGGQGPIKPFMPLVFEVELFEIK